MKTKPYEILKSNIGNLKFFIKIMSVTVKCLPEQITKINFDYLCENFTQLLLKILNRVPIEFKKSEEDFNKNIKQIIFKRFGQQKIAHIRLLKGVSEKILSMDIYRNYNELNRQSSVILLVAFFEAYLKDAFIAILNKNKECGLPFLEKSLKISDIKEYGFNLSNSIGNLVANKINFQDIDEVSSTYNRAFKIDIFNGNRKLKEKIKKLFQERHILVHNNCKIDKKYIMIVKCSSRKLGKKILINKKDIYEYIDSVLKLAKNIESMRIRKFKTSLKRNN